jgi:hypothetical protein
MPTFGQLRGAWEDVRGDTGLADDTLLVFYTCRHTRAIRLVDANVHILEIMKRLGRKRVGTSQR